ncbi:MAG: aldo/keto reductase [Pseudanabaenaceae cyanobacterium]
MRYRRFGRTEMQLPVFSLGTMRYLQSEENAVATIFQAVAVGINHLETAKGYGKSEEFIGAAMRAGLHRQRDRLYITTKIPPTPDYPTMADLIRRSLQRLNVDYIDNFDVHGINTWEHLAMVKNPEGCMKAVQEAVTDGRIRHVGFSTHGSLEVILAAIELDIFASVNLHYYYFNQRNAPAVQRAHEKDMGVFIISPSDKGGMLYNPPPLLQELCQPFTPLYLNDRFLLSDPRVHTLSLGAANPAEVMTHQEVWDNDGPLTPLEQEVLQRLDAQYQVLGSDRCSQCFQCLPCPEGIHIPEALRLRNLAVAFDMVEFGRYRYNMFEKAGHWFPGTLPRKCTECGECLPKCPEHLNIPALLFDTDRRLAGPAGQRLWE